jgi:molybdate transport system permease protein
MNRRSPPAHACASRPVRRSPFEWLATGTLVVFGTLVVALLAANVAYVDAASFGEIASSRPIRAAFWLSLWTSLTATAVSVVVAIPSAYALSRCPFRGRLFFDLLVDLLIVMPVLVIGVSLLVFFRVGGEWSQSGFPPLRWLGAAVTASGDVFIYSRAGIVLAQFLCSVSYAIRTFKAAFDELDPRTEHVALTLGCSRAGAFARVTLPMARDGILAGTLLTWVRAFGLFAAVAIVGGTVRGRTEVLPSSIYLEISIGRIEVALAISLVMVAVATVVLLAMRLMAGRTRLAPGRTRGRA